MKLGAPSPYSDDPFHYVWDWNQDVFRVVESSTQAPTEEISGSQAMHLILTHSMRPDLPVEDLAAFLESPTNAEVQYSVTSRKPIAVLWQDVDGHFVVFVTAPWATVDWATHAAQ